MNEQEISALDKFRRIRAAHLAATWRAAADILELLPGLTEDDDAYIAALDLLRCDDHEDAAGLPGRVVDLLLPIPVLAHDAGPTPDEFREFAQSEAYRRAHEASARATGLVQEMREDADTLDEFPALVRFGPGTREFEHQLYEAQALRDGLVRDDIEFQLSPDEDELSPGSGRRARSRGAEVAGTGFLVSLVLDCPVLPGRQWDGASCRKRDSGRTDMSLRFLAIDPDTNGENCPALFLEEETGDLLFQGWTVTAPQTLAESGTHSPLADDESLVRLPARMRNIIMEALNDGAAVQRADRGDEEDSGPFGDPGRLHA
jgi:hypothetical protein